MSDSLMGFPLGRRIENFITYGTEEEVILIKRNIGSIRGHFFKIEKKNVSRIFKGTSRLVSIYFLKKNHKMQGLELYKASHRMIVNNLGNERWSCQMA
jgi:hypothetical protein